MFFEKFGREEPVKSVIAKMMKKFRKTGSLLDKNRNRQQKSVLTPGILQDIQTSFPTLTVNTDHSVRIDNNTFERVEEFK